MKVHLKAIHNSPFRSNSATRRRRQSSTRGTEVMSGSGALFLPEMSHLGPRKAAIINAGVT